MQIALCVDSIVPMLTGIGRNCMELVRRLPLDKRICQLRFLYGAHWIDDPEALRLAAPVLRRAGIVGRMFGRVRDRAILRNCIVHSPNYFLPDHVDSGIITVHDLSVFRHPETHPRERLEDFDLRFGRSVDRAKHILTDSEAMKREIMDFTGFAAERVSVVYMGVSPDFYPRSPEQCSQILAEHGLEYGQYTLCVSSFEPRKRVSQLIMAYQELDNATRSRHPLVLIGGEGWLNSDLMEQIRRARSEGWLRVPGYVPDADLSAIYAGASLFAFPSIYEGFGLPPIEAMASGVPVIASNRSCIPEVTRGAALLIDPDDIGSFRDCLEAGLTDSAWRQSAVEAGVGVAAGYSWDRCVSETIDVYERVQNGGS